jgi:hypothetical protein
VLTFSGEGAYALATDLPLEKLKQEFGDSPVRTSRVWDTTKAAVIGLTLYASDEARFKTGSNIAIDGGMSL